MTSPPPSVDTRHVYRGGVLRTRMRPVKTRRKQRGKKGKRVISHLWTCELHGGHFRDDCVACAWEKATSDGFIIPPPEIGFTVIVIVVSHE